MVSNESLVVPLGSSLKPLGETHPSVLFTGLFGHPKGLILDSESEKDVLVKNVSKVVFHVKLEILYLSMVKIEGRSLKERTT